MKTYRIRGVLKVRGIGDRRGGPLHIGASDAPSAYVDSAILRDSAGCPLLPGASLCGVLSSLARASLRAAGHEPETHPAFIGLFGSARGAGGTAGQASRLSVRDSCLSDSDHISLVRDRNGISRERGGADDKRLFHEEVVDGEWGFPLDMEFSETGPRTAEEQSCGGNPDVLSLRLLLDALCLLTAGWATIGGKAAVGYGRVKLEGCQITTRDRCSPDDVLSYAKNRWASFPSTPLANFLTSVSPLPPSGRRDRCVPERLRFTCTLRPVEPLLVKTGYTTEVRVSRCATHAAASGLDLPWPLDPQRFSVDAGFCLDARQKSYVPGSSMRGALRSHVERAVRTVVGRRAAWNLQEAQEEGQKFSERGTFPESDVECLISPVFGFSALGGRILVTDAVPLHPDTFEQRRKLFDHVALDRFTGGAADQRKFNSRPYFPGPTEDDRGDLQCKIELYDFAAWHLGLLLLLLRDLRLGRIILGHGKNKGFGRVRLTGATAEALTAPGGFLEGALPGDAPSLGGLRTFTTGLSFDAHHYLCPEAGGPLADLFSSAMRAFRRRMAEWQPRSSVEAGGRS